MAKACNRCGSTRWRRAPGGTRVCEEGHVDMSYRRETIDTGQATNNLRIRRETRKRVRKDKTDHRVYWGKEFEYLHYELVVLLVRHQTAALRQLWDLPPSFEIIVRDLLQLLLQLYPLPPMPLALLKSSTATNTPANGSRSGSPAAHRKRRPSAPALPQSPRKRGFESEDEDGAGVGVVGRASGSESEGSSTEGGGSDGSGAEDDEEDGSVLADVEAVHHSSSSSSASSSFSGESDLDGSARDEAKPDLRKKAKAAFTPVKRRIKAVDALAVVLLGAYMVRAPFLLTEAIALVNTHKLPYLDFTYSDLIPADMRPHFNSHVYSSLSPAFAPNVKTLHRTLRALAGKLHKAFGIVVPELNVGPVLWHCCRALGLSPVFYALAKQLARQLDLHFSLSPALAAHPYSPSTRPASADAPDEGGSGRTRNARVLHGDAVPPELAAMCACVLAAKLVYFQVDGGGGGSKGKGRGGKGKAGPGAVWDAVEEGGGAEVVGEGVLGRAEWSQGLRTVLEGLEADLGEDRLATGDFDPLELQGADLDRYLDLVGDVLADGMPPPKAYDIFTALPLPSAPPSLPAPPPPPHALFPPLYRASSVLTSKTALPPSFPPPSETARYPLFAPDDHSGVLPPAMRVLAAVAARTVGVGVEDVMLALGEFERRLVCKEKERRANERRAARARGDEGDGLDG